METPIVRRKRGISPVWILPLVALCIGAWILYTSYRDAGISITIHYENAEGITPGKTQVIYKGVPIGLVERVAVDEDLQGVTLTVQMEKKAKRGLVEDTKFWIVRPEISAGRISGLATILTGSFIATQPGTSTVFTDGFEGLPEPPIIQPDSPGLHITLKADALNSLQKGSPVYTRNLQIGIVKSYHLTDDNYILIDLFIEPEFSHLIKTGTRFWNSSGINFEGNLQAGFSLKVESLASLIYGGISCGTPESLVEKSPAAANGMVYKLYSSFDAAEYGLDLTLQLASGGGIIEGKTKIMYRGLEAGVVKKITLNDDANHTVSAEILLDPRTEAILKKGTRFWVVRPEISFDGVKNMEAILTGPYITFQPGEGEYQDHFVVEEGNMPRQMLRSGKRYSLVSADCGFLEPGAPVLHKKMTVGEVVGITFRPDAENIRTEILIYDEYSELVREDTVFWNVSGIEVDAGPARFNVNVSSLKSILAGGIALINPQRGAGRISPAAEDGSSFTLFASFSQAVKNTPSLRPRGILLHLLSSSDNAFDTGSPVLYKRIPVGEVLDFTLSDDRQGIVFTVLIYEQYADLINTSTRFYNFSGFTVNADLSGVEVQAGPIAAIVAGGISFMTTADGEPVHDNFTFVLYENYEAALYRDSIPVTIRLDNAGGVKEGTKITYQGIPIGSVTGVHFSPDMQTVMAEARVRREAEELLRHNTLLRLVQPEIALTGVRHLETVFTGPYIEIIPGDGEPQAVFSLLRDVPDPDSYPGLNIVLETPRLGSLNRNSPVYYRQVQVGEVTGFVLSPTAQQVWVHVNIRPSFANLVRTGTRFWGVSGIRASWNLFSGFNLDTESMEAVVAGGIALATPDGEEMGGPAGNGDHFVLHEENEQSWLDWNPVIMLNEETQLTGRTD